MLKLSDFACSYVHHELYWSALCIAQHSLPSFSSHGLYIAIRSLHGLGFHKKIQSIIDSHPDLLRYHEVRLIYIKSGFDCPGDSSESIELPKCQSIDRKSLELFHNALFKKEGLRKKLLVDSFLTDKTNVEPIIYLYKESLCTPQEIVLYVQQVENSELKSMMTSLVGGILDADDIMCPLVIYSMSLSCQMLGYNHQETSSLIGITTSSRLEELFRISAKNLDMLSESEFIYFAIGLYYLHKGRCKQALRCFYRSFEINKEYGMGYLYAGISHSFLKETESAVRVLNMAFSIMRYSYLPSYYLAYEYQLMNNLGKTKYYYKNCIDIIEHDSNRFVVKKARKDCSYTREEMSIIHGFIYCLIYNEEYEEAMQCIKCYNVENLLKVFCLLFNGMFDEAGKALDVCERNSAYHATRGYLYHLVDDFDPSIREYEKCLLQSKSQVIEDLLSMAVANLAGTRPNKAFDYSNCLFETLEYKSRIMFISNDFK